MVRSDGRPGIHYSKRLPGELKNVRVRGVSPPNTTQSVGLDLAPKRAIAPPARSLRPPRPRVASRPVQMGGWSDPSAGIGRTVGPYRLLDVIGEGGMGIVYQAEHTASRQRVAIKTVRLPHERQLESLRREIFALGRIRHAGVVRILDEGVENGVPWYAMELLRGETLSDYNRRAWQVF